MTTDEVIDEAPPRWLRWWRVARPVLIVAVSLFALKVLYRILAPIDWSSVWDSLRLLTPLAIFLLLFFVALRQVFNAKPLTNFVSGLPLRRSIMNDLTAFLMGTVAPPPSDTVLRVSMFKSWNVDPVEGMAGVTLNSLTYYVVRFFAPAIGLLFLAFQDVESGHALGAAISVLISAVIVGVLLSISRGDRLSRLIGLNAGRVATHFKKTVEPDKWAAAVVDFRARIGDRVQTGIVPSLGALVLMVLCDASVLFVAVRAVGVGSDVLPLAIVYGSFLLVYPLTLFPLAGLGVVDAVLVTAWLDYAGDSYEAQFVAALIIWRVVTLIVVLLCGLVSLFAWRRMARKLEDELQPSS